MIKFLKQAILCAVFFSSIVAVGQGQKTPWRQATDAELASLLPARAPVEKEHIETEMRTASGIVDARGHYIAGVVLITAENMEQPEMKELLHPPLDKYLK